MQPVWKFCPGWELLYENEKGDNRKSLICGRGGHFTGGFPFWVPAGEKPFITLSGQEIPALTESGEYEGESFSLTPGVHRITLRAELGAEESLFAEICSEQTYYKALRANRVNMSGGQTEQSFLVYVLDRIPAVNLRCGFSGTGAEALSELTLRKTALGSRMLFLLFLTGFLCLDFLLWFRRQVLAEKISKKKQVASGVC